MVERLTLDTSVLVAAERGYLDLAVVATDDADVSVPAIVVAEYLTGVHLADTDARRTSRRDFLSRVLDVLPVEAYTQPIAERHVELLAHVRRSGASRGAHDLIIAATAAATGRVLVTMDASGSFDELPGVSAHVIAVS